MRGAVQSRDGVRSGSGGSSLSLSLSLSPPKDDLIIPRAMPRVSLVRRLQRCDALSSSLLARPFSDAHSADVFSLFVP